MFSCQDSSRNFSNDSLKDSSLDTSKDFFSNFSSYSVRSSSRSSSINLPKLSSKNRPIVPIVLNSENPLKFLEVVRKCFQKFAREAFFMNFLRILWRFFRIFSTVNIPTISKCFIKNFARNSLRILSTNPYIFLQKKKFFIHYWKKILQEKIFQ